MTTEPNGRSSIGRRLRAANSAASAATRSSASASSSSSKRSSPKLKLTLRRSSDNSTDIPQPSPSRGGRRLQKHFDEPPLAKPLAGVTGQPLEEPPNSISKRELGASTKKRAMNKEQREVAHELMRKLDEKESCYEANLTTRSSEEITESSELRTPLSEAVVNPALATSPSYVDQRPSKRRRKSSIILKASPVKISHKNGRVNLGQGVIKHETPEPGFGADASSSANVSSIEEESDGAYNHDYCSSCGLPGSFICCEGCPKSFHFHCLNPPMDAQHLPDTWYCPECVGKKWQENHSDKKHTRNVGIFAQLLDTLEFTCSQAFRLPHDISEAYEGVAMDKYGDFMDDSMKPVRTYRQIVKEMEDPVGQVYDSEGKPFFCYKCGESALNNRQIIRCDYCPLNWHLDCLDPPLGTVKRLGSKWMCPNHAETVVKPKLKLRDQPEIEVARTRGVKLPSDANIEIVNVDDAPEEDVSLRYVYDKKNADLLMEADPTFHYTNVPKGFGYAYTEPMSKYVKDAELQNVTYRLKEEGVVLDFIRGAKIQKSKEAQQQDRQNMAAYGKLKPDLKDYLWGLSQLSKRSLVSDTQKKVNLNELLKYVDGETKIENGTLDNDELHDLLIIKRLIEMKGQDKLMDFLKKQ